VEDADLRPIVRELTKRAGTSRVDRTLRLLLDPIARVARFQNKSVHLTQRQFAVLHCLTSRGGRPVAADEMMTYVWGQHASNEKSRQILDVYIFQVRNKLARIGLKGAISTIRGFGYAASQVAGD
jgi:DNA-binding response OmpR family regulator